MVDPKRDQSEKETADEGADDGLPKSLLKLGKYGAYTAPALLAMLTSQAAAQGSRT